MASVPEDQASVKSEDIAGSRVKFLCSYGGKILPRPQDGHLRYVGGETRMVAVNRNISYAELAAKLHKLFGPSLYLKYQLPNEDLDALISVTCDEDMENMIDEYDKNEAREGSSRLRAFLFPAPSSFTPVVQDFLEEPESPDQKYMEAVRGTRIVSKVSNDSSSGAAFQVPDFLFGLDPGNYQQRNNYPRQHDGEVFSPTHVHSPAYRELLPSSRFPGGRSSVTSFGSPFIVVSQADYSREPSTLMDTGVRGPALSSSAVGLIVPTSPIRHCIRDTKKVWDGGFTGEQRGEQKEVRKSEEPIGDTNYRTTQHREARAEDGLQRVSSKDRLTLHALDGSPPDTSPILERHTKIQKQPIHTPGLEKHKPEEVQMDLPGLFSELRQENAIITGGRFQRNPEFQRCAPQANLGTQGYEGTSEPPLGSRTNSGDSDQELQKGMDSQVVDIVLCKDPVITDSQTEGLNYQDVHRFEEKMIPPQQKQGDFDVSLQLPSHQIDISQHMHLGRGHFQQVHWQACDAQEQQPPHESLRLHDAATQKMILSHTTVPPPPGATVQHQHSPFTPVNTGWVLPPVDGSPNTRLPSPLYRQAGNSTIPVIMRSDPQQLGRAVSPLRESPPANEPLSPHRHGFRVAQVHDCRTLHPTTIQQSSSFPVSPPFVDFSEPHEIYEQAHLGEKVIKGNSDAGIGQVHYSDKMAGHEQAMSHTYYIEDNLKANP